jgi:hypothetical protein
MTKERLEEILFSGGLPVYAILDGASIPDLPMKLYEMRPPNYCLFRGELEPDMASVAPYLVALLPRDPFTEWILKDSFGKHWAVFLQSTHSLKDLRGHFRALITVFNEEGNPMIFRYYDPRVMTTYLPTCTDEELNEFFGGTKKFFAEAAAKGSLMSYTLEKGKLKETEIKKEGN